ncbi:protein serine/threonine kinase, putative [Entamoeba invadens IP1]|uniref:Protein serine/threonine kinase, putative n=1 Tax=Entamoeba invadens IP1 TaxID=370355 RepID=A0A0A1U1X4_ENTIV|nr:protein serine/threonine kinase, putative [Entamoeba invadens IP1]ELP88014.1 protein serine/threonine kinase, putative [Entamoeba invadens IP1]|eukprot:XP_004254785.1 protein serine/threonine kinase, putative [Entamoeba invadens IP1]
MSSTVCIPKTSRCNDGYISNDTVALPPFNCDEILIYDSFTFTDMCFSAFITVPDLIVKDGANVELTIGKDYIESFGNGVFENNTRITLTLLTMSNLVFTTIQMGNNVKLSIMNDFKIQNQTIVLEHMQSIDVYGNLELHNVTISIKDSSLFVSGSLQLTKSVLLTFGQSSISANCIYLNSTQFSFNHTLSIFTTISADKLLFSGNSNGDLPSNLILKVDKLYLKDDTTISTSLLSSNIRTISLLDLSDNSRLNSFNFVANLSFVLNMSGFSQLVIPQQSKFVTYIKTSTSHMYDNSLIICNATFSGFSIFTMHNSSRIKTYGVSFISLIDEFYMMDNSSIYLFGSSFFSPNKMWMSNTSYLSIKEASSFLYFCDTFLDYYKGTIVEMRDESILEINMKDDLHQIDGIYQVTLYNWSQVLVKGEDKYNFYKVEMYDNSLLQIGENKNVSIWELKTHDNSNIQFLNNTSTTIRYLETFDNTTFLIDMDAFLYERCTVLDQYFDTCYGLIANWTFHSINVDLLNIQNGKSIFNVFDGIVSFSDTNLTHFKLPEYMCVDLMSFASDVNSIPKITREGVYSDLEGSVLTYCPVNISQERVCKMIHPIWESKRKYTYTFPFAQVHCPYTNCFVKTQFREIIIGDLEVQATFLSEVNITLTTSTKTRNICGNIVYVIFPQKTLFGASCDNSNFVRISYTSENGMYEYTSLCELNINQKAWETLLVCDQSIATQISILSDKDKEWNQEDKSEYNEYTQKSTFKGVSETLTVDGVIYSVTTSTPIVVTFVDQIHPINFSSTVSTRVVVLSKIGVFFEGRLCEIMVVSDNIVSCLNSVVNECLQNYYFDIEQHKCLSCSFDNCNICNQNKCLLCENQYILQNTSCIAMPSGCLIASGNICRKCKTGYSYNDGVCESTPSILNCLVIRSNKCVQCCSGQDKYILVDGVCVLATNAVTVKVSSIILCEDGYFNNGNVCSPCDVIVSHCLICSTLGCMECANGYSTTSSMTCEPLHCLLFDALETCTLCEQGYGLDTSNRCIIKKTNCDIQSGSSCKKCDSTYCLSNDGCYPFISNCVESKDIGCVRCKDGFYLNEKYVCVRCDANCKTCSTRGSFCLSCYENTFLSESKCIIADEMRNTCSAYTINGVCVRCHDRYYLDNTTCLSCSESCATCNRANSCLVCRSDMFMSVNGVCLLQSEVKGCVGNISISHGCLECATGYYLKNRVCYVCASGCYSCTDTNICLKCKDDFVMKKMECVSYRTINHCTSAIDSRCTSCDFWHNPDVSGLFCVSSPVWWVIVLVIIFGVLVIVMIVLTLICIVVTVYKKSVATLQMESQIYSIKDNTSLTHVLCSKIYTDVKELTFGSEENLLPVKETIACQFIIGNKSKNKTLVQLKGIKKPYKYTVKVQPEVVILKNNQGCTFTAFISVNCSCKVVDHISILFNDFQTTKNHYVTIPIHVETILTTSLDSNEVTMASEVGEGNFGRVFKGTFRGNEVAVKVLKQFNIDKISLAEFKKEVAMLDKMRCDQIIHFYGSIRSKQLIAIVTELAPYGSLRDRFESTNECQPPNTFKYKVMDDIAKALFYLHNNGIMHRDVKPDNILMFELHEITDVNAKLADFGMSRNINMLITGVTFTKGVGSPIYMAPEMIVSNTYKIEADVFAFGLSLLECMKWRQAYEKPEFNYMWQVADFVSKGNRLERPQNVDEDIFDLVKMCWRQEPKERPTMREVLNILDTFLRKAK